MDPASAAPADKDKRRRHGCGALAREDRAHRRYSDCETSSLVEASGFEPPTFRVQGGRSPD